MELTKEQRRIVKALKGQLGFGAQQQIADKLKIHRVTVCNVLRGKWWNQDVIDTAVEIIRERNKSLEDFAKDILKHKI